MSLKDVECDIGLVHGETGVTIRKFVHWLSLALKGYVTEESLERRLAATPELRRWVDAEIATRIRDQTPLALRNMVGEIVGEMMVQQDKPAKQAEPKSEGNLSEEQEREFDGVVRQLRKLVDRNPTRRNLSTYQQQLTADLAATRTELGKAMSRIVDLSTERDNLRAESKSRGEEIRNIEQLIGNRPTMDKFKTLYDKVQHALATAAKADRLDRELDQARLGINALEEIVPLLTPDNRSSLYDRVQYAVNQAREVEGLRRELNEVRGTLFRQTNLTVNKAREFDQLDRFISDLDGIVPGHTPDGNRALLQRVMYVVGEMAQVQQLKAQIAEKDARLVELHSGDLAREARDRDRDIGTLKADVERLHGLLAMWESGTLTQDTKKPPPEQGEAPEPRLVVCQHQRGTECHKCQHNGLHGEWGACAASCFYHEGPTCGPVKKEEEKP